MTTTKLKNGKPAIANGKPPLNQAEIVRGYVAMYERRKLSDISAMILADTGIKIAPKDIELIMSHARKRHLVPSAENSDAKRALVMAAKLIVTAGGARQAQAALDAAKELSVVFDA
jgi:hypothetical protein